MNRSIETRFFVGLLSFFVWGCKLCFAADYPSRPIRVIVPFPPGGNTDVLARILGQKVTEHWNQQVVIDNRPGAAGLLGADIVTKGSSDGYTLLMTALGGITEENLKYFAPLMLVST